MKEDEKRGWKLEMPLCDAAHESESLQQTLARMPDEENFIEIALLFQQLSDSTRLKILWLLTHEEICVYDIAAILGIKAPAVSHHLRSLRQLGLINYRRDGKHAFYSLSESVEAQQIAHMLDDAFEDTWHFCGDCVKRTEQVEQNWKS